MTQPSDSSVNYFSDNTITHYTTQLPQEMRLQGRWAIVLTENQFSQLFLHVRPGYELENRIVLLSIPDNELAPMSKKEPYNIRTDNVFYVMILFINIHYLD